VGREGVTACAGHIFIAMFGGTKKKLAKLQAAIDAIKEDVATREQEVARERESVRRCEADTAAVQEELAQNRGTLAKLKLKSDDAERTLNPLNEELQEQQRQLSAALERNRTSQARKAELRRELSNSVVDVVKEEQHATELSAELAREALVRLQGEQEQERSKWDDAKKAHERLQRDTDTSQQNCAQARRARDSLKAEWASQQDEFAEIQTSFQQLEEDHAKTLVVFREQKSKGEQWDAELKRLDEELLQLNRENETLQKDHDWRKAELSHSSRSLNEGKDALQKHLENYGGQIAEVKASRDQAVRRHEELKAVLSDFLPEHFELQMQHAERRRELEMVKRDLDALKWEDHKVKRDLGMLMNSYQTGFVPSVGALRA